MMEVKYAMTGGQKAATRANSTSSVLKNLFFNQIRNQTLTFIDIAKKNALNYPENPTGRLSSAIRLKKFTETQSTFKGEAIVDGRVAPYAEWVEFGHYAGPSGIANRTWVPGLHYWEAAFLEVRSTSKRRIDSGFEKGNRWYDSPGVIHRETGEQLSVI